MRFKENQGLQLVLYLPSSVGLLAAERDPCISGWLSYCATDTDTDFGILRLYAIQDCTKVKMKLPSAKDQYFRGLLFMDLGTVITDLVYTQSLRD